MPGDERFQPRDASAVPRFADVATFMRCQRHEITEEIDVGLVGVPFDLGVNYRSGARRGPAGVREASRLIRRVHPTSAIKPFDICNVADLGDCPVNPLDLDASVRLIQAYFERLHAARIIPIAVGGDHTIPIPILRALARERPVGVLHFDAHADTLDEMFGTKVNHATFMRRAHEEGLVDAERVIQIGLRGSRFGDDDIGYGVDAGYTMITIDDYEDMGRAKAIEAIDRVLGDGPVYISLDVDGLDPAYAIGTGVPEIGGLLPRDVQVMLRALSGKELIGADISEVAPDLDPSGLTCITAANLMFEMLCVIAESVASRKDGMG